MRFLRSLPLFLIILTLAMTAASQAPAGQAGGGGQGAGAGRGPAAPPLTMSIPGFADGTDIPAKFTAAGTSTSPAISWTNVPPGTVTFVLHVHDLEVSRMKTTEDQLHWLVWNIPAAVTSLPEGVPMGATLDNGAFQTSAGGAAYRGMGAPATGPRHHYTFELFALDTKLDIQPGADGFATWTDISKAIQGHILGKAVYMGLFHRPPA
jgi:Raf kinase inhibitor-like YbhB/YbcL family protein